MSLNPILYINPDPQSTNARIRSIEQQLSAGGREMNVDLQDRYMMIFHNRANGYNIHADLQALECDLEERSLTARGELSRIIEALQYQHPGIQLNHWLQIHPDGINSDGSPCWDFTLRTPLRWFGAGPWIPSSTWLDPPAVPDNQMPMGHYQALIGPGLGSSAAIHSSNQELVQYSCPNPAMANSSQASFGQYIAPYPAYRNQSHNNWNKTAVGLPSQLYPDFQPCRALQKGSRRIISADVQQRLQEMGFELNPKWEGELDAWTLRNQSCTPEQNCSLFIMKVHPGATPYEFFGTITEGAVFSMHRKPPGAGISTCAISLVFVTREAAEAYHRKGNSAAGIFIRGIRLNVRWNRERVLPVPDNETYQSRVLLISGPGQIVNLDSILRRLRGLLTMATSHEYQWNDGPGRLLCEIGFGSIRGQSRAAYKFLVQELLVGVPPNQWTVAYGPDPCNPYPIQPHPRRPARPQYQLPPPQTFQL